MEEGIKHGITGNYYAMSEKKEIVEEICRKINKSVGSIYWREKYKMWAIRVKNKAQKLILKEIKDEQELQRRIRREGI